MKLQNLIKQIEKATGKKIEKNEGRNGNTVFYMINGGHSISFYENGQGSGDVRAVCCTLKAAQEADGNPMNMNCYDSFERKVKNVVSFIAG